MSDPHEESANERHDRRVERVLWLMVFVICTLVVLALLGPALGNLFMSNGGQL